MTIGWLYQCMPVLAHLVLDTTSFTFTLHRLSTYGRRAFAVAGPTMFNTLPDDLRDPAVSTSTFRQSLKTHLFSAYQHV